MTRVQWINSDPSGSEGPTRPSGTHFEDDYLGLSGSMGHSGQEMGRYAYPMPPGAWKKNKPVNRKYNTNTKMIKSEYIYDPKQKRYNRYSKYPSHRDYQQEISEKKYQTWVSSQRGSRNMPENQEVWKIHDKMYGKPRYYNPTKKMGVQVIQQKKRPRSVPTKAKQQNQRYNTK